MEVKISGKHEHPQEKKQLRGAEKLALGAKILANHGGSSHEARLADLASNPEMTTTGEQYRSSKRYKMDEEVRSFTSSKCWLRSLMDISEGLATIDHKNQPDPYVHKLQVANQFSMMLQTNAQLDIQKEIPPEFSQGKIDSTGQLIKIPKTSNDTYASIMNYLFIVKGEIKF